MADTADTEKPDSGQYSRTADNGAAAEEDNTPHHGMSTREYINIIFTSLKPPMLSAPNPFRLVRMLNRQQWAFFAVAFFAWVSSGPAPFPPRSPPPTPPFLEFSAASG